MNRTKYPSHKRKEKQLDYMLTEESDKAGHMSSLWSESIYVHCTQLVVTYVFVLNLGHAGFIE